ncbi:NAD-dependent epimerase/dehydratase family protein [Thermoleophilum album]|uniref:Nucleoside-diphosphate-sugar epimerase n=1 Tax=Thermoleophilum album TaxID=29539 RepID=A0A1H6FSA9_THEAL|nr:NAD-dependent epimerase/dehydratase family protein [Thermoleophilum album]SEH12644.1 Nucleoside-diphosphate-sugar epimerase [Thermoleophilum album]
MTDRAPSARNQLPGVAARVAAAAATWQGRRVAITGACGFIGRALRQRLEAAGAEVVGIDKRGRREAGVIAGDLALPGPWQDAIADCELVIHCAARVSNLGSRTQFWRDNVLALRRVIDAVAGRGARLVHLSSVRAFSDREFPDGVCEHQPVRPDGHLYVDTKIASEQVALQAHAAGEVVCTVIRPGDVWGPGSRPWTVLPVELIRRRRFMLPAWGRGLFSPVYVDNLVDGIVLATAEPRAAGRVFTITDGMAVPTRVFFAHYCRMLGVRGPLGGPTWLVRALTAVAGTFDRLKGLDSELSPAAVDYFLRYGSYSIDEARRVLGYAPRVDLAEGMRRTEAWLRERGLVGA